MKRRRVTSSTFRLTQRLKHWGSLQGTSVFYLCLSRDGGPSGPAASWPPPPAPASGWPWPWPRMWRAGRRSDGGGSASVGPCRCSGTSALWWARWARWSCRHCPWQWIQRSLHRNDGEKCWNKSTSTEGKKSLFFYWCMQCSYICRHHNRVRSSIVNSTALGANGGIQGSLYQLMSEAVQTTQRLTTSH